MCNQENTGPVSFTDVVK